jgi:hypothetical protein
LLGTFTTAVVALGMVFVRRLPDAPPPRPAAAAGRDDDGEEDGAGGHEKELLIQRPAAAPAPGASTTLSLLWRKSTMAGDCRDRTVLCCWPR